MSTKILIAVDAKHEALLRRALAMAEEMEQLGLAAEVSFATTSELLHEMSGADLCPETVRTLVEGHGQAMARFQAEDAVSDEAFRAAAGAVEFTTDAGKVNTRQEGWKDLKIAVV